MKNISVPIYPTKNEAYDRLDGMLKHLAKEDVYLASFKTKEFLEEERKHGIIPEASIRNTDATMPEASVHVIPGLTFKVGTCLFSENRKSLGLSRHIHLPKTDLPTITIGKKIFKGEDKVMFNFYRRTAPPNINLTEDFVLRFNSTILPHEIVVPDDKQSIWLFIVLEHCGDIDLEDVRKFYNCEAIYDYYG